MNSLYFDKIDDSSIQMMDCDSKVGVLATEDESGYPHLSFISSIQAMGDRANIRPVLRGAQQALHHGSSKGRLPRAQRG